MSRLEGDLERFVVQNIEKLQEEQTITVAMDSGEWK
jgi:hypothetical protein